MSDSKSTGDKSRVKNTKKTRKTAKKTQSIVKKPKVVSADARLRKKPQYKTFRLHPRIKHPGPPLPSWFELSRRALQLLRANSRAIGWFIVVYGLLFLVFVRGVVAPVDIQGIRNQLEQYTGAASSFSNNITILGLMINSSLSASGEVSGMYQVIFIITSSLALIWLFRQQQAGEPVGLKQAYYRGMYPLVPFFLVLLTTLVQVIPAAIGNMLYGSVVRGGLAVTFVEQLFWFLFFLLLIILSLYFISVSIIALFVVTLPEMTPWVALEESKKLVEHRRIPLLLRLIALILIVAVAYVGIIFPAIFVSAALTQVLFFALTVVALPFIVAYLFVLYRELL